MPRFSSMACLTASSIEIRRTDSPGCCAAFCAAVWTATLRLAAPGCPEPDSCCPKADTDEMVTRAATAAAIRAKNGCCRRITDDSIERVRLKPDTTNEKGSGSCRTLRMKKGPAHAGHYERKRVRLTPGTTNEKGSG